MEKKSRRIARVNELLKEEIAKILRENLTTEDILITVLLCETAFNLQSAKITLSVMPPEKGEIVLRNIQENIFDIQQQLNKTLNMRPVPKLYFELSGAGEKTRRIDKILREINSRKK